jgi:hypothetical protein
MLANSHALVYNSGRINHYERKLGTMTERKDIYRNAKVTKEETVGN